MSGKHKHTTIAQELCSGHSVTFFTVGISMRPLLTERKTHVTVAPISEAKNGDILLYLRKNGRLVLHRCIKQDDRYYYMRGDNTYGLEPIAKTQAIGVATHVYRQGRMINLKASAAYRTYAVLWTGLYPLRWILWKLLSAAKGLLKHK